VPFKFTGKIAKVTIDLKEMPPALRAEAARAQRESDLLKAIAN
jgi:hypothetical protein